MSTLSSPVTTSSRRTVPGTRRAGFVLSIIVCVLNLPSVLLSAPDGEVGPPFGIMLLCTVLSAIGLVATVLAWRGSALARRIAAGCLVVLVVSSLPAFFVDVSMAIKVASAVGCLVTVLTIGLMFSGGRTTRA